MFKKHIAPYLIQIPIMASGAVHESKPLNLPWGKVVPYAEFVVFHFKFGHNGAYLLYKTKNKELLMVEIDDAPPSAYRELYLSGTDWDIKQILKLDGEIQIIDNIKPSEVCREWIKNQLINKQDKFVELENIKLPSKAHTKYYVLATSLRLPNSK